MSSSTPLPNNQSSPHPSAAHTELVAKPKIGVALGGGGARGLAHILMLEVLDELDVQPHRMVGTSIGAIFAAAYASGLSAQEIRSITQDMFMRRFDTIRQFFTEHEAPVQKLLSVIRLRKALLDPRALLDLILAAHIPDTFEALKIPLEIVATDMERREPVYFSEGKLHAALAASIAIPIVFTPVTMGPRVFSDGGLSDPLPYASLQKDCDIIIAIDVSGASADAAITPNPSAATMVTQSIQIMQKRLIRAQLAVNQPDIYIDVPLDQYGAYHFTKLKDILADAAPAKAMFKTKLQRLLASTPA